jgi:hypothetical protein
VTVANYLTDNDLNAAAFGLAHSMLTMCDRNGLGPDIIGVPDQMDVDVFRRSFEIDAELYMSMNPDRLVEEYDEIREAASKNGPTADPNSVVERAKIDLEAIWQGEAADAFVIQLGRVQNCITSQHEYTLVAAQAVGMMYAVSVSFRASCHDLMSQTSIVCDVIADKLAPQPTNWSKVAVDIAGKVIDVVKNPTQIADMAIDELLNLVGKATEEKPVEGAEAVPVINGYVDARDRLFESYEQALGSIKDWVSARRNEYLGLADDMIPEPLPPYADVDSPDFSYERFFYLDHAPGDHAPEVDRERQRYVEEKTDPHGVIAAWLAGNG